MLESSSAGLLAPYFLLSSFSFVFSLYILYHSCVVFLPSCCKGIFMIVSHAHRSICLNIVQLLLFSLLSLLHMYIFRTLFIPCALSCLLTLSVFISVFMETLDSFHLPYISSSCSFNTILILRVKICIAYSLLFFSPFSFFHVLNLYLNTNERYIYNNDPYSIVL